MMVKAFFLVVVLLSIIGLTCGQADGWKMTDRFFGFRFELGGDQLDNSLLEQVQAHADQQSCFGWIQKSRNFNFVGEVRCSKGRGNQFLDWLQKLPHVTYFESLVRDCTGMRQSFIICVYRYIQIPKSGSISHISRYWMPTERLAFLTNLISALSLLLLTKMLHHPPLLEMSSKTAVYCLNIIVSNV